jgi:Tfp pilus assembly protein PilX
MHMAKNNSKKNQRGVSLFLVTIMIAVLMGFSLSVATIIITSTKITSNMADSVKAFHASDSGIEYALCRINSTCATATSLSQLACAADPGTSFSGTIDSNTSYSGAAINADTACGTGTTVTSSGTFGGSTRKIQINY